MAWHHANFGIGSFRFSVRTPFDEVAEDISKIYPDALTAPAHTFSDFAITIQSVSPLRRYLRRQVDFLWDAQRPFKPLPRAQAYPMLEWGMNWCVANHAHQFLILHAAVIEKLGSAVVLPAEPGAGKSTLTAAMVHRGWRLLSDELALISLDSPLVHPFPRPINLKNDSIDIVQDIYGDAAVMSRRVPDTHKGTIALLQAPSASVSRMLEPAKIGALAFPRYESGSGLETEEVADAVAFQMAIGHAFNYTTVGEQGFKSLGSVIKTTNPCQFRYSSFDAVDEFLTGLVS